jgi:hypothetical protein
MIRSDCVWGMLGLCGSLLVAAVPTGTQAAELSAPYASASDIKVVCHKVKKSGSHTRERLCATPQQWRAFRDMKIVCRSGKRPGAAGKEQFCATVAQWRSPATRPPGWIRARPPSWPVEASLGYSPAVPGNSNFGTVANQHDFQR